MDAPSRCPLRPVSGPAFRHVPWRASDLLIALAPLAALRVVPEVIALDQLGALERRAVSAVSIGALVWMLAFPTWVARRRLGRLPRAPGARAMAIEGAWAVLLLGGLWVTLIAGYTIWVLAFGPPAEPPSPVDRLVRSTDPTAHVLFAVLAVLLAPLAEEVLFRGMAYNALRQWMPVWVALPVQAAAFGFLHPYGLTYAALATFVGLALALVYEWRRTLLTPVLVHAFHNLAVVAYVLVFAFVLRPPVLGVNAEPADGGCRVTHVWPGTAAADAGLRPGDLITTVDGRPVANAQDIRAAILWRRAGDTVVVDFVRDGDPLWVEAVLKRPE